MSLREQIRDALAAAARSHVAHFYWDHGTLDETCAECQVDAVVAVVEPMLWRARNLVRGRCRYCGAVVDPSLSPARRPTPDGWVPVEAKPHRMDCPHYVGPLEHHWINTKFNGTFGGIDHYCACGGWFRQGGMAGHGDGSETAEPVCPNAGQTHREAAT